MSYHQLTDVPKKIQSIQFGLLSPAEMCRLSELNVSSRELFTLPARRPASLGVLDPRLGVSDKSSVCETCREKLTDCAGHFGFIDLALPVFHIGYFKHTLSLLQCICKSCSRVLLPLDTGPVTYNKMLAKFRARGPDGAPVADVLARQKLFKKVVEACKKCHTCHRCGARNGAVKKVPGLPTLKVVHEVYSAKGGEAEKEEFIGRIATTAEANPEFRKIVDDNTKFKNLMCEDLLPTRVMELFLQIPDADAEVLWLDPLIGRPENLLLRNLLVPPVPIRPSVAMDVGGGSNEDDLTVKLQEIIDVNIALKLALQKGAPHKTILEEWDFLHMQVSQYINGEMPGLQRPAGASKQIRGLCQRLKGKSGRFRGNLSGKRVDFSARTVISPDPNLEITQVGVPLHVARVMTFPERVTTHNMEKLKAAIRNGPDVWPGANHVLKPSKKDPKVELKIALQYAKRDQCATSLVIGDTVERHMTDGDVVLFNRQPSLHKLSVMAHEVVVMPWRTFRFNICVCAPYNADFDGDEMNMHLPQTEEARTEARLLMGVDNNLITPRNGEPLVAASQDFLTASYLITQKDQFYGKETFCQMVSYLFDANQHIDLPQPAILKPVELWTGKQVFSLMVKPNKACDILINLEMKEKNYDSKAGNKSLCKNDGWVCWRQSELMSGNIAKKTIGDGSKTGLFYVLLQDWGCTNAAKVMNRLAKLCSRYLGTHKGFSIGLDDVTPSTEMKAIKAGILNEGYALAAENIAKYEKGELKLRPGCNMIQSLEEILNGLLGKLRENAGQEAMKALPWSNAPRIMAECGSKGSPLNISQMIACVGQQAVGGLRIQNGFVNRTLPHFKTGELTPKAKGFVANSFCSGLSATEFFFHTMGGREGLVDTAVKTAETGYMARRLMKALEDLSLQYDSTVRNSEKTIVQFTYGDDGLNPEVMEDNDRPIEFGRLKVNVCLANPDAKAMNLSPEEIMCEVEKWLAPEGRFQELKPKWVKMQEEEDEEEDEKKKKKKKKAKPSSGRSLAKEFKIFTEIRAYFTGLCKVYTGHEEELGKAVTGKKAKAAMLEHVTWADSRFTRLQLGIFLERVHKRYMKSCVQPGEAVGATGAQSISEPGTQMTLKTFHFAGVSSMNVTLGVPRLKEIINASKAISTPIITARLKNGKSEPAARIVKSQIERTTLGEISSYIEEVYTDSAAYLKVKLSAAAISDLQLDCDADVVRERILQGVPGQTRPPILRLLKDKDVLVKKTSAGRSLYTLRVMVPGEKKKPGVPLGEDGPQNSYFLMQQLKAALPKVICCGIPTVNRAVINETDGKCDGSKVGVEDDKFHLLIEGMGLLDVMGSDGVDSKYTETNHIAEIFDTLGVEAARKKIAMEISYIMGAYGIGIDNRHMLLLSDVMTFKGEVLGITRFGVSKMRESVLMLASFEKTTDHLFDAAVHGRTDEIVGVSECIIMGIPIPLGTGLFKLMKKAQHSSEYRGRVGGGRKASKVVKKDKEVSKGDIVGRVGEERGLKGGMGAVTKMMQLLPQGRRKVSLFGQQRMAEFTAGMASVAVN